MSKHEKDIAARLSEFRDAHQEYKETKSENARRRRHEAMFKESPETARRAAEILARESFDEGQARRDRLNKVGFQGWKKKG